MSALRDMRGSSATPTCCAARAGGAQTLISRHLHQTSIATPGNVESELSKAGFATSIIVLRYRVAKEGKAVKHRQIVKDSEYRALSDFRQSIHDYLDFSDRTAKAAGIEPRQYQLMLAIKGLPAEAEPSVGTLAERLRVRHHSAVELIDRAGRNGLIERKRSANGRLVL